MVGVHCGEGPPLTRGVCTEVLCCVQIIEQLQVSGFEQRGHAAGFESVRVRWGSSACAVRVRVARWKKFTLTSMWGSILVSQAVQLVPACYGCSPFLHIISGRSQSKGFTRGGGFHTGARQGKGGRGRGWW